MSFLIVIFSIVYLTADIYLTIFQKFKTAWQSELSDKRFKIRFLITLFFWFSSILFLARFIAITEHRQGFIFNDPLLVLFPAINLTWLTFGLIYIGLIIAVGSLTFHPRELVLGLQAYVLVASIRLMTVYFLPLNAPPGIIPMKDPLVAFFGGGGTLINDLFFSGHTATMFLFYLTNPNRKFRALFLICTMLIAVCILAQHVHYTIDVIIAPFVSYTCYRIIIIINQGIKKS